MRIDKITEKTFDVFKYITLAYLIVAVYYFINLPTNVGDEALFLSDLEMIKNMGWQQAVVKNISIPYMVLAYPLSLIMENFIALRLVNILLFIGLLGYFYFGSKIRTKAFYLYILFFSSTTGYFYIGTNDSLIFVALVVFFNEVKTTIKNKIPNFNLALTALIIAFFTRQLFVVYLPIIIIGLYLLYKSGVKFSLKSLIPLTVFGMLLFLNVPSITANGTLSYDKKAPPSEFGVSWSQRTYLSQLMVNKGEIENGQHASWEETQKYIIKNGKDSLPDGVVNGMTFNYQLTITEFFKDFANAFAYSFRSLGFMLLFSLLFCFKEMKKNRKMDWDYFVPFATIVMLMIFSFIMICYVELRWLMPVFIMTIMYYSELEHQNKIPKRFVLANYVVLCVFSVYGIFRILNKI